MTVKMTNQANHQVHKYHPLTIYYHFYSEDDYRSGCLNVSHCHKQFLSEPTLIRTITRQNTDTGLKRFPINFHVQTIFQSQ